MAEAATLASAADLCGFAQCLFAFKTQFSLILSLKDFSLWICWLIEMFFEDIIEISRRACTRRLSMPWGTPCPGTACSPSRTGLSRPAVASRPVKTDKYYLIISLTFPLECWDWLQNLYLNLSLELYILGSVHAWCPQWLYNFIIEIHCPQPGLCRVESGHRCTRLCQAQCIGIGSKAMHRFFKMN